MWSRYLIFSPDKPVPNGLTSYLSLISMRAKLQGFIVYAYFMELCINFD